VRGFVRMTWASLFMSNGAPRASVLRSLTGCLVRTLRAFPFLRGSCLRSAIRRRTTATEAAKEAVSSQRDRVCIAAANAFARDGHNVLVYSPQRSQIDPLVREFKHMHKQGYLTDVKAPAAAELVTALAIGREWLGEKHAAVEALKIGVGTHHGALPRPFQSAIEDLLDRKLLRSSSPPLR